MLSFISHCHRHIIECFGLNWIGLLLICAFLNYIMVCATWYGLEWGDWHEETGFWRKNFIKQSDTCSVTRLDYGFIWWTNKVGFWIPIQFVEMKSKIDYFHMMSIKITEQQTNFGIRTTPGDLKGDQRTLSRSSNVLFNLVYVGVIWVLCRAISEVWKYGYG